MKMNTIKKKLFLNKTTVSRLDNLEMSFAFGGDCPPPSSLGIEQTCPKYTCSFPLDYTKAESTAGC